MFENAGSAVSFSGWLLVFNNTDSNNHDPGADALMRAGLDLRLSPSLEVTCRRNRYSSEKEVQSYLFPHEVETGTTSQAGVVILFQRQSLTAPEPLMRSPLVAVRTQLRKGLGVDGLGLHMTLRFQRPLNPR